MDSAVKDDSSPNARPQGNQNQALNVLVLEVVKFPQRGAVWAAT